MAPWGEDSALFCPILDKSVASQLVKNGVFQMKNRKSAQLVSKKVSDLWKISTPTGKSISRYFTSEEFTSALQQLNPGPESICPELIIYVGAFLKPCLYKLLYFCMRQLKLPKLKNKQQ